MASNELARRNSGTIATRKPRLEPVLLEDTTIIYPNFTGRASEFNIEGDRNFNVVLTDEQAAEMHALGWNVKTREGREDGEPDLHTLKVSIGYKFYPPKIYMMSESQMNAQIRVKSMAEDMLGLLDNVDYKIVDLIIRAHFWEKGSKSGFKAWVQTLVIVVKEDAIMKKYRAFIDDAIEGEVEIEEIQANNDPAIDVKWDMIEDAS